MPTPSYDIDQLVDRYTENLLRAAYSLGFQKHDAEELVQDTFVAFLEGGQRFSGKSRLLTYLFGILYNKARTARRLQSREKATEAIEEVFDSHFDRGGDWDEDQLRRLSEPEKEAHVQGLGALLQRCLEGLTENLRLAFSLREVEGLAPEAICEVLGVTRTHLGVCLFRARNKLRECITAQGGFIL
jgi:RNA polymerase sigma factor (sigma-70 family)